MNIIWKMGPKPSWFVAAEKHKHKAKAAVD